MRNRGKYWILCLIFSSLIGCNRGETVAIQGGGIGLKDTSPITTNAGDWPWWRGPYHNGTAEMQKVPLQWAEEENVLWKVALPGKGHASPIVVEDRIFLHR